MAGMIFQTRSGTGTNHAVHNSNFCLDGALESRELTDILLQKAFMICITCSGIHIYLASHFTYSETTSLVLLR